MSRMPSKPTKAETSRAARIMVQLDILTRGMSAVDVFNLMATYVTVQASRCTNPHEAARLFCDQVLRYMASDAYRKTAMPPRISDAALRSRERVAAIEKIRRKSALRKAQALGGKLVRPASLPKPN